MTKLIISTGAATTGKTTAAHEWQREQPEVRRVVGTIESARGHLRNGRDVWLDAEELTLPGITIEHRPFLTEGERAERLLAEFEEKSFVPATDSPLELVKFVLAKTATKED